MSELIVIDPATGEELELLATGTRERMERAREEFLDEEDNSHTPEELVVQPAK
jgi:hypothetical protein